MEKIFFLLMALFLSPCLLAQTNEPYEIYNYLQVGDTIILSNGGHVRSTPSRNGKSIDQLPIGSVLYINEDGGYHGVGNEVIYNLKTGYYSVRYEKSGEWKTGYIWGGLIASSHSIDKNKNQFLLGRRSFNSEEYELTYAIIRIDGESKKVHEQSFSYPLGDQSSFESKVLGNMGLSNLQQLFRVGFLGEACGVYTTYHYYGWNGSEFIELPTKNSMGDAGVFGYSENLLFPTEHKLGKDFIIIESTTTNIDYVQYKELEGKEFEVEETVKETKIYHWNGKIAKLLDPLPVNY